jgi:hypothetical protein
MANGNGSVYNEELFLNSSPLSKYVRPVLGLIGGIGGIIVSLLISVYCAVALNNLQASGLFVAAAIAFGYFYIQIRGTDKITSMFASLMQKDAATISTLVGAPGTKATPSCGPSVVYKEPQWWDEQASTPKVVETQKSLASFDFDEILESLKKEAVEEDGLKWTPMLAALRFRNWVVNIARWENVTNATTEYKRALEYAIKLGESAYKTVIGANPPGSYEPMANYNKFITSLKQDTTNKYGCGKVDGEAVRVAVMTLRNLYRDYEGKS